MAGYDDTVPVFGRPPATDRTDYLRTMFEDYFRHPPEFYVRVPGRVNLIGEHVDYCGYPVLPMALEQDVIIAVRGTVEPTLHIINRNPSYRDYVGPINELHTSHGTKPEWYEYIMCGIIGAAEMAYPDSTPRGITLAVCGTIPPAAGLSSSSALVCAAALAYLHDNEVKLSKMQMAMLCARSERLIGTAGGGMDQAIAFLAEEGCASYISWNPLSSTPVSLPQEAVFVVAHSLVEANKAANNVFNDRVQSCTIAAQIIAQSHGLEDDPITGRLTIAKVQNLLGVDLDKMRELVAALPITVGNLKIRDRATHVIEEAIRVEQFRSVCANLKDCGDWESVLGNLMRSSHRSLSELYESSHDVLNEMVRLSDEFGVHARVTGAGWGGCIVALLPRSKVESYVQMLITTFYSRSSLARGCDTNQLVFVTAPHRGALIYGAT
ncbi:N-acetylgalactosamine kinase [Arctopsyche grandis]|uniref:N-acetylgalactosamine kinase n=1 Tax=Arctopsyche grandis TaxID=121162 RepID=UPI00406D73ED